MLSLRTPAYVATTPSTSRPSVLVRSAAQAGPAAGTAKPDLNDPKVRAVRETLAKEHIHHDKGHVLQFTVEGRGRRASVGREIEHTANLSGMATKTTDYSYFD